MTRKRDISISLIRVAAMFMIISDHILCKLAFPMQSLVVQTANSGVFIFLFISGYLYGKKQMVLQQNDTNLYPDVDFYGSGFCRRSDCVSPV